MDIDTDIYTVEQAKAATEQIIKNKRSGSKVLKDITLGQFFPGDSLLHKLDPRVKLIP